MTEIKIVGVHPVAQLFPLVNDAELALLAEDIKLNGLLMPITLDPNGILLDGRNRLAACEAAGVDPRFATHSGGPVEFILSKNIARRHLNVGQRTMIVALASPDPGQCGRKSTFASVSETFVPPEWLSPSRLSEARKIAKYSPELAREVAAGFRPFQQALDEATMLRVTIKHNDPLPYGTPSLSILNGSFTKQAHKTQRLEACKSETLMTDAELLQHYIQCNRIIHGAQRCPGHHRLLKLGFIAEHPVSIKNLMITVTAAGRTAIDSRPAEYVGTHPTPHGAALTAR